MGIIDKIKQIFSKPDKFFSNLNKEKTVQDALLFYVVLSAISMVLGYFVTVIFGNFFTKFIIDIIGLGLTIPGVNPLDLISSTLIGYVFNVFGTFLIAGILYVWLLIFKGNQGYVKAYQLYIYAETPSLLLGWIPFIGFFAWIYSLVLLITGTKTIYKFSSLKATLIYLIPIVIFIVIAIIALAIFVTMLKNSGPFFL